MAARAHNAKSAVGVRYGKFIVLGYAGAYRKKWPLVKVRCDCGTNKTVRLSCLRSGQLKSCGCLAREKWVNHHNPDAAILQKFLGYASGAHRRGLQFHLSLEEFKNLITSNCHYCGSPPMNRVVIKREFSDCSVVCNGIDRVDSDGHYVLSNVVPCCTFCNFAKQDGSVTEFEAWLDRVREFRGKRTLPVI